MKPIILCALLSPLLLLQGCAGVAVVGAATTASAFSDPRSIGTQIDDQGIELKAAKLIVDDKRLTPDCRINAISHNGRVLLVGQTPSEELRAHAEEVISTIPGLRMIYNELRIGSPISLGSQSSDSWLTTKVKVKLYDDEAVPMGKIKVVTENGEVFLVGMVTTQEAKTAVEIARNINGVRKVIKVFELSNEQ